MTDAGEITFTRLTDGTVLQRHADGTYRPVTSGTDHARLAALTEAEVERMAASDPDHPAPDDAVWDGAPEPTGTAVAIRLRSDVLDDCRGGGPGDQTRINAVLRRSVRTRPRSELTTRRRARVGPALTAGCCRACARAARRPWCAAWRARARCGAGSSGA